MPMTHQSFLTRLPNVYRHLVCVVSRSGLAWRARNVRFKVCNNALSTLLCQRVVTLIYQSGVFSRGVKSSIVKTAVHPTSVPGTLDFG